MPYGLRPMDWDDLDQVASMEKEAFPTLWPPTSYRREMKNKLAEYTVCVQDGEYVTVENKSGKRRLFGLLGRRRGEPTVLHRQMLVGFVGLWFMAGEAHIVAVAVRESYRRRGLGELLLIGAIEMGLRRGQEVVTLEARVSNEAAKALYAKYGFKEVGLRRGYYSDNNEDALIMSTDKLTSEPSQAIFNERREAFNERYGEADRLYM